MKCGKKIMKILRIIVLAIVAIIVVSYINHRIQLFKEKALLKPMGQMVSVNGHEMSVYVKGTGNATIVFMSGGGTCSPILDFKSLYSLLSDDYKIAVVEKYGYGYSDVVDEERDIDTILSETRKALKMAGVEGPYVLAPHSMSGIEALYWAQQYPDEISAIIGLDMAVPQAYEDYKINMWAIRLGQFAARLGITRWIPGMSESDAIKYGTLTEEEKEIYRAMFYNKTATTTMINEVESIKDNARRVGSSHVPKVPMLLFISNGEGTGWDENTWRAYQINYLQNVEDGEYIELDCPHYIQDYEYERISSEIKSFLDSFCANF